MAGKTKANIGFEKQHGQKTVKNDFRSEQRLSMIAEESLSYGNKD